MKRLFDIVASILCLILLSVVMLLIALIIKLTSRGPVLFTQKRVGKNNIEFNILKFRTMRVGTPNLATDLLVNPEQYITPVGKFLRKTSLDELPQLFNILRGEMSFVGPRPALYNQYELNKARNSLGINRLIPGLTGWAQINGRDELSLDEKLKFDMEYLNSRSILFDIEIILKTFLKVIKKEGVK